MKATCEYDKNHTKSDWVKCWCTKIKEGETHMISVDKYLDRCPKLKEVKNA